MAAGDGVFFIVEVAVADCPHAGGGAHGAKEVGDAFDVAGVVLGLVKFDEAVGCGRFGGVSYSLVGGDGGGAYGQGTEGECESEGESAACAGSGCECSRDNRKHGFFLM